MVSLKTKIIYIFFQQNIFENVCEKNVDDFIQAEMR